MKILVINVGSTSLKYDAYDMDTETRIANGSLDGVVARADIAAAVAGLPTRLGISSAEIGAVGHRVVHGGEHGVKPMKIDAAVERIIEECAQFAPSHNPRSLAAVRAARDAFPGVPHVAVFDTAFHAAMPERSYLYGLPYELDLERGVRRFGFHGPSHQYMMACAAEELRADASRLRLVTCHLGGGASITAIERGVSIDTSMGLTPLDGLVMTTRPGDIDPALPLLARWGASFEQLERVFNEQSGLVGISGIDSDFRSIQAAADLGIPRARFAIDVFVQRIQRYIGGYVAELGGADAIVFTGGVGENAWRVRERVCANLAYMGVTLDAGRNKAARPRDHGGVIDVSEPHARTRVLVVHTEEERMIAREVMRCIAGPTAALAGVHATRFRSVSPLVTCIFADETATCCSALTTSWRNAVASATLSVCDARDRRSRRPRGELAWRGDYQPATGRDAGRLARTGRHPSRHRPAARLSGDLQGIWARCCAARAAMSPSITARSSPTATSTRAPRPRGASRRRRPRRDSRRGRWSTRGDLGDVDRARGLRPSRSSCTSTTMSQRHRAR